MTKEPEANLTLLFSSSCVSCGHPLQTGGEGGASIVSRVMGLILASIAATNVLEGIKDYFQ